MLELKNPSEFNGFEYRCWIRWNSAESLYGPPGGFRWISMTGSNADPLDFYEILAVSTALSISKDSEGILRNSTEFYEIRRMPPEHSIV